MNRFTTRALRRARGAVIVLGGGVLLLSSPPSRCSSAPIRNSALSEPMAKEETVAAGILPDREIEDDAAALSSDAELLAVSGADSVRLMLSSFRRMRSELDRTGDLSPSSFIDAARANVAIYGHIFGKTSFLARLLGRTTGRQLRLLEAIVADPRTPLAARQSLKSLLLWEIRERGEKWSHSRQSCVHAVRWLGRGLCFIGAFMGIFSSERDEAPHRAARRAYDAELGPFHASFVAFFAQSAFYFAPRDRRSLYVRFAFIDAQGNATAHTLCDALPGTPVTLTAIDDAVCRDLAECAALMMPVLSEIKSFLESHRLNTNDKSEIVFAESTVR